MRNCSSGARTRAWASSSARAAQRALQLRHSARAVHAGGVGWHAGVWHCRAWHSAPGKHARVQYLIVGSAAGAGTASQQGAKGSCWGRRYWELGRQPPLGGRQAAKGFKPLARQAAKSQAGRQAGGAGRQAGRAAGRQKGRQAGALRQAAGRQAGGQGGGGGFSSERRAGRRLRARVHTPRGEDGIQGSKGGLNVVWHINAPSVHS